VSTQADINRLVERPAPEIKLDSAVEPEAIRSKTGLERKLVGIGTVQSEEITAQSTDGLFTFIVRVVTV
jgi:hypothetical protein